MTSTIHPSLLVPFDTDLVRLEDLGGKGANLVRLTKAGFPVPRGFILTTAAYQAFVAANDLQDVIFSAIENLSATDIENLEKASARIRAAFQVGRLPLELKKQLLEGYSMFQGAPVAVRSSATTEDLPELSFAGLQDTFLNVSGETQLFEAVIHCWSSLWTARAIGYRLRNHIPQAEIALAVVIQPMVTSEVSGVLFTANPLNGLLNESVINAVYGLGEALVAGKVEPDQFIVDHLLDEQGGAVKQMQLGAKQLSARSKNGGGVEMVGESGEARQTLSADQLQQLVVSGQHIQRVFGSPQDIEWAFEKDTLYILQTRPITSLFPVPYVSVDPLAVWISFGSVQGMIDAVTPLGRDVFRHILLSAGKLFGVNPNPSERGVFGSAGERLWIKVSDVMRNPLGRKVLLSAIKFVDPGIERILQSLRDDPRLAVGRVKIITLYRLARFFLPLAVRFLHNMIFPQRLHGGFEAIIEQRLQAMRIAPATNRFDQLRSIVQFIQDEVAGSLPYVLPRFIPVFAPAMASLTFLARISRNTDLTLKVTRGLNYNVTTQMDLALWQVAAAIKADRTAEELFRSADAAKLAELYLNNTLPAAAQQPIVSFMDKYGMRGVGEIDIGQPRWRENPSPVMHTIQGYLNFAPDAAPDIVFSKSERSACEAIEELAASARRGFWGGLKAKLVRAAARRVRLFIGYRESPKFFAIRVMGMARAGLLAAGEEFARAGTIDRADDLVFLNLAELTSLAKQAARDWKSLIADRRRAYQRERMRRQVPRVIASDGRAFYEGLGAESDVDHLISGSPVSPGSVEGVVHVVFDPRSARLEPGEILVCPGTDPAWTPLFLLAGGLITEVGGMMTHGSVVAREYGIPAVVGVHQATLRLKTGQRVRLDGSQGTIEILAPLPEPPNH